MAALIADQTKLGADSRQLLRDVAQTYVQYADRYLQEHKNLLSDLARLSGSQTQSVNVPAGSIYQAFQTTLKDGVTTTARQQLLDYATANKLVLSWKKAPAKLPSDPLVDGTRHPDPTRADRGERLYELVGITKNGKSVAFEAQHAETVTFDGPTRNVIKDLTSVVLKTTARCERRSPLAG